MGVRKTNKEMEGSHQLLFERDRLNTFETNWEEMKGFKHCTPQNFAAAGFYNCSSEEFPDNVRCFSCQKELSSWEKNDDPWKEHVKRGKTCPYVIFKNKKTTTIQDFLQLHFDTKKNLLNSYFEQQEEKLKKKEEVLLKNFGKTKK